MTKREASRLEKDLRNDGHGAEWIALEPVKGIQPAGHVAISASDLNRIFYSRKQYQEWKASMESGEYA